MCDDASHTMTCDDEFSQYTTTIRALQTFRFFLFKRTQSEALVYSFHKLRLHALIQIPEACMDCRSSMDTRVRPANGSQILNGLLQGRCTTYRHDDLLTPLRATTSDPGFWIDILLTRQRRAAMFMYPSKEDSGR